ncbi:zinc-ribbon domain-containing protein [Micrococcus yunnanensis]|uniref:zinc-ribbon domain-containing protein n=1 Tax=Micrococcus yunnanensis TaxID=566027 RepID=UPI003AB92E59
MVIDPESRPASGGLAVNHWTQLTLTRRGNARAWWHCSVCGSDWEARINERTRRQNVGCPTCGRGRTAAARMRPESGRSLADLYPDIAAQWHPSRNAPLTATEVVPHKVV